jgi:hypothetical protein
VAQHFKSYLNVLLLDVVLHHNVVSHLLLLLLGPILEDVASILLIRNVNFF